MAICTWCTQEMLVASSCSIEVLHQSGVLPGGLHHLGCDILECPSCGGQLLGGDCRYDEDGPDEDDQDDEGDWFVAS